MSELSKISPSVVLLPLVLVGKITHKEAHTIATTLKHQQIPYHTKELQKQIENVLERKLK